MNAALFRPGTSDRAIWVNVVENNEYRLPEKFESSDVILDIGGQTGSFSYACIQRGAGKVIAFEPDPENYVLFRKQMKQELKDGRCEVYPIAVVGGSGFSWGILSGPLKENGEINYGGSFLMGGNQRVAELVSSPTKVPCVGFEDIVFPRMNRRLCKIDAEGSEFEIINQSWCLCGFQQVVGEYHPHESWSPVALQNLMLRAFNVELVPHPNSNLGLFFATRR